MDLVCNGSINTNIITYGALGPIPHKKVVPCEVVMLDERN